MSRALVTIAIVVFYAPASGYAQEPPRAAIVAADSVPPEVLRGLTTALLEHADVMPAATVRDAAEEAAISLDALDASGELMRALDVVLLVRARVGARRRLEITFYEPGAGSEFLSHRVALGRGGHLSEDATLELVRVMEDAVATGVVVAGGGDVGDSLDTDDEIPESDDTDGGGETDDGGAGDAGLSAYASVGAGLGLRELEITRDEAGPLTLSASFFSTFALAIGARIDGLARDRLSLRLDVAYRTSVGLTTEEVRQDESVREVDSRAHDLLATLGVRYRLAPVDRAVSIGADVGVRWAAFELADPVSVPSASYLGPLALAVIEAPFGTRRVVGTAALGVQMALSTGDLGRAAESTSAPIVIAHAALRFGLGASFALTVSYDEIHAILERASDTDRRADLAITFSP